MGNQIVCEVAKPFPFVFKSCKNINFSPSNSFIMSFAWFHLLIHKLWSFVPPHWRHLHPLDIKARDAKKFHFSKATCFSHFAVGPVLGPILIIDRFLYRSPPTCNGNTNSGLENIFRCNKKIHSRF